MAVGESKFQPVPWRWKNRKRERNRSWKGFASHMLCTYMYVIRDAARFPNGRMDENALRLIFSLVGSDQAVMH